MATRWSTLLSFLSALRNSLKDKVVVRLQRVSWSDRAKVGLQSTHRPGQLETLEIVEVATLAYLQLPDREAAIELDDARIYCEPSFTTYRYDGRFVVLIFVFLHDEGLLRIISVEPHSPDGGGSASIVPFRPRPQSPSGRSAFSDQTDRLAARCPVVLTGLLSEDDRAFVAEVARPKSVLVARRDARLTRSGPLVVRRIALQGNHFAGDIRKLIALATRYEAVNPFVRAILQSVRDQPTPSANTIAYAARRTPTGCIKIAGIGATFKFGRRVHVIIVAPLTSGRGSNRVLCTLTTALMATQAGELQSGGDVLVIVPGERTTALLDSAHAQQDNALQRLRQAGGVRMGAMPADLAATLSEMLSYSHFCGIRFAADSVQAIADQFDGLPGSSWRLGSDAAGEPGDLIEWPTIPVFEFNISRLCVRIDVADSLAGATQPVERLVPPKKT
jgi:hypothetical protein